jgi:hypothetical protein
MEEKNASGKPIYKTETLQDFIAMIIFSSGRPLDELSDPLKGILGAFASRSKLDGKVDLKKHLDGYFKKNPLPKALVESFNTERKKKDSAMPTMAIRG